MKNVQPPGYSNRLVHIAFRQICVFIFSGETFTLPRRRLLLLLSSKGPSKPIPSLFGLLIMDNGLKQTSMGLTPHLCGPAANATHVTWHMKPPNGGNIKVAYSVLAAGCFWTCTWKNGYLWPYIMFFDPRNSFLGSKILKNYGIMGRIGPERAFLLFF